MGILETVYGIIKYTTIKWIKRNKKWWVSRTKIKGTIMGRAIDLFVTYRFIKLLVTPFNKTEAFKLGIIDEKGKRVKIPGTNKATPLNTIAERKRFLKKYLVLELSKVHMPPLCFC